MPPLLTARAATQLPSYEWPERPEHCLVTPSVGIQCPLTSSLREFPSYWDWLWCHGRSPVLRSIAFQYLGVFHLRTYTLKFCKNWFRKLNAVCILLYIHPYANLWYWGL